MFRRLVQRRAAKVEARNWASVSHLLEADERPVEYISAVAPRDRGLGGMVWLTDRRMIWTFVAYDGRSQIYHDELPLSAIEAVGLADNGRAVVVLFKEPIGDNPATAFKLHRGMPLPLVLLFIQKCWRLLAAQ